MKFDLKALVAVMGMAFSASGAAAQDVAIAGNWRLDLCGSSGQDLCGIMTYGYDQSEQVQRYVGRDVFDSAQRIGPASWKGSLIFAGHKMNGTVTLAEPDRIEIDGCAMLIICGKFNMYREGSTIPR
jgi:hypothetical protein